MSVVPLSRPVATTATAADRAIRVSITVIAAYLAATVWPMLLYRQATHECGPLGAHLAALAIALAALRVRRAALAPLRDLLPLALGPFLYVELRWLIAGLGRPHRDATVIGWEHAVFRGDPSASWAPAMHVVALSELLHAAYASYYLLVLLPPLLLYARRRRPAFAATVLALTITYGACFAAYLIFPVDGPRYLVGAAAAPEGPVRTFVLHLLAAGSSRGTAFPSSHVAASVVASLCALRYQRRLGVAIAVLTAGLTLGTVYGGFHYGVDALAGVSAGVVCWLAAGAVWQAVAPPGEQSATAA